MDGRWVLVELFEGSVASSPPYAALPVLFSLALFRVCLHISASVAILPRQQRSHIQVPGMNGEARGGGFALVDSLSCLIRLPLNDRPHTSLHFCFLPSCSKRSASLPDKTSGRWVLMVDLANFCDHGLRPASDGKGLVGESHFIFGINSPSSSQAQEPLQSVKDLSRHTHIFTISAISHNSHNHPFQHLPLQPTDSGPPNSRYDITFNCLT